MNAIPSPNGVIVRQLRKAFGDNPAVAGIDLEIRSGEIFGLVGPDGAGKTTILRMLCGILDSDGGTAEVGGFPVREEPEAVKSIIGYMPQRFSLYGDLTVAENITFFANLFHVPPVYRQQREQELLTASRMQPFRDRLARNLSGGMKQKLALTCTLIHRPRILFLDEPTTGVDPVSRRDFWKILYSLVREGITLVVSTPYMDEAERCNRLAFLHRGRVLQCASPQALKQGISGEWLEVCGEEPAVLTRHLQGLPVVHGLQMFGDRLHIRVSHGDQAIPVFRHTLEQAGCRPLSIRRIQPTLEDVFIALATNGNGGNEVRA